MCVDAGVTSRSSMLQKPMGSDMVKWLVDCRGQMITYKTEQRTVSIVNEVSDSARGAVKKATKERRTSA